MVDIGLVGKDLQYFSKLLPNSLEKVIVDDLYLVVHESEGLNSARLDTAHLVKKYTKTNTNINIYINAITNANTNT